MRSQIYETQAIDLIHPLQYNDENLNFANIAYKNHTRKIKHIVNPALSYENLKKQPNMLWLDKIETILIYPAHTSQEQEAQLNDLYTELYNNARIIHDEINLNNPRPLISLDLETTGLNKTIKRNQGANIIYNDIVGVCIAINAHRGYYLPLKHTGLDNVLNFDKTLTIAFIQRLIDDFHIIYHNAQFDHEVLSLNGIKLVNQSFSDTMLLAIANGYRETHRQVGLKFLAKTLLKRTMLEIKELTNTPEIELQYEPAQNVYVYGACDAINTLALFDYILQDENPYKSQPFAIELDHRSVEITRSLYRVGLPLDYDCALKTLKTIIRRLIMIENIFYAKVSEDISISSPEQLGTYFFNLIRLDFEKKFNNATPLSHKDALFNSLKTQLFENFGLEIKIKELKSQEIRVVANSNDFVLQKLYNKLLSTLEWLDTAIKDLILLIIELIQGYRSLLHELNICYKMIRSCYNDDLNLCRTGIGLKLNGTNTTRFSNQTGSNGLAFDSLQITELKSKMKAEYILNNGGLCGINAQGISSNGGTFKTLRKVKNYSTLSQKINEVNTTLNNMVDAKLLDLFNTNKYNSI